MSDAFDPATHHVAEPRWFEDFLVGERFVILAYDQGDPGRLDDGDLGFDFDKGAVLRRLGEIFTGEGLVEWAPLAGGTEG